MIGTPGLPDPLLDCLPTSEAIAEVVLADKGDLGTGEDARAILFAGGGRRFLVATVRLVEGAIEARLRRAEIALRRLSSVESLEMVGLDFGFRLEDLLSVRVAAPETEHDAGRRWLTRRLQRECEIVLAPQAAEDAETVVVAMFAERGQLPTSQRKRYVRADDRVRVEAFELHVVEHCNLRCAHCCNMSPYLPPRTLSADEVRDLCARMAGHLHADVFKIMGGEPLLHPRITDVLHATRASGIGDVVRLFTNGLLLHKMDDAFWRALDHLTVSSYASAPVPAVHLELIERKAAEFDVVLNVKPVDRFSEVMHASRRNDDVEVQSTYDACWLRHRCLVVRDRRFFKCTRAAYLADFHDRVALDGAETDPAALQRDDGLAIDAPDFGERLVPYLNATAPLHACRFCLGSSGPLNPHVMLSKSDVRQGRLHPASLRIASEG